MRLARRLRLERSGSDLTLTQLSALGIARPLRRPDDRRAGGDREGQAAVDDAHRQLPPGAGLVTRAAHESDGRQVVVGLTDEAQAVLDEDRRRRDAWLAMHLADLDPDERDLLRTVAPLLDRMASEP